MPHYGNDQRLSRERLRGHRPDATPLDSLDMPDDFHNRPATPSRCVIDPPQRDSFDSICEEVVVQDELKAIRREVQAMGAKVQDILRLELQSFLQSQPKGVVVVPATPSGRAVVPAFCEGQSSHSTAGAGQLSINIPSACVGHEPQPSTRGTGNDPWFSESSTALTNQALPRRQLRSNTFLRRQMLGEAGSRHSSRSNTETSLPVEPFPPPPLELKPVLPLPTEPAPEPNLVGSFDLASPTEFSPLSVAAVTPCSTKGSVCSGGSDRPVHCSVQDSSPTQSLQRRAYGLVHSASFDYMSAALVFANSVTIGLQTDHMARHVVDHPPLGYRIIDVGFCVAFTAELCLRFLALGCGFFYRSGWRWNLFDLLLVGMQLIDEIMSTLASSIFSGGFNFSFMRVLRILRLVRIIRIIRILRLIGELRTIVSSIMGSLKSLAWTVVLLFLLVYVFGVYFTQLVLDHRLTSVGPSDGLELYFGSLGRSILSLYQAISGGVDWDDIAAPLISQISVALGFVVAFYIAFAMLALLNVVTGVFVESALKSAKEDRDMYMLHHVRSLFCWADKDGNGTLSWTEFEAQLVNPQMQEFFQSIDVDVSDARGVFQILDTDDSGQIDLDEFLNGCLGLHGPAKAIHLSTLMYEARVMSKQQKSHADKVEAGLHKLISWIGTECDGTRIDAGQLQALLATLQRDETQDNEYSPKRPLATFKDERFENPAGSKYKSNASNASIVNSDQGLQQSEALESGLVSKGDAVLCSLGLKSPKSPNLLRSMPQHAVKEAEIQHGNGSDEIVRVSSGRTPSEDQSSEPSPIPGTIACP